MSHIDGTKKFDLSKVTYAKPKPVGKGKVINVKYGGKNMMFSTPVMLTWGASDYEGNNKFELSIQFPREEEKTDASNMLKTNLENMYNHMISAAMANSKEWLGKEIKSEDIIRDKLGPILKYPKIKGTNEPDMTKEPTIRPKFQQYNDVYQCNVYDDTGSPLWLRDKASTYSADTTPMSFFRKGMKVMSLVEFSGIWVVNGNLHVTLKLVQAVTQKPVESVFQAGCLLSVSQEDKNAISSSVAEEDDDDGDDKQIDTAVESSDEEEEIEVEEEVEEEEEEEEEPEPEPEPEPVKAVKKKVIKKKTK
jgi:hypothetical protein